MTKPTNYIVEDFATDVITVHNDIQSAIEVIQTHELTHSGAHITKAFTVNPDNMTGVSTYSNHYNFYVETDSGRVYKFGCEYAMIGFVTQKGLKDYSVFIANKP